MSGPPAKHDFNMHTKMRAAVTSGHGGPGQLNVVSDAPVPLPAPGEVRVRVAAAAVNNTDIWSREGRYGTAADPEAIAGWRGVPLDFPRIQGGDASGTIESVGEGVDPARLGQRVLIDPALYDPDTDDGVPTWIMGSEFDGAFAEYVVVRSDRAHDMTDSPLSDVELACLPIAYGTAMGMLERAGFQSGERVLVTGASGGVGLAAVQLAAARGCCVVASTSESKVDLVLAKGASEARIRGDDRLAELGPFDAVAEVVGGTEFGALIAALKPSGRLVVCGAIAGPVVELDLRRLYLEQRRIIGSTMHTAAHFRLLADAARSGAVKPVVAATFPLARIAEAQEMFATKGFVGKIVLEI